MAAGEDAADTARRCTVVSDYRKKLLDLRELRVGTVRENARNFAKIQDYLEPLESVGERTGEVLCPFDNEHFIVKASCGPRYCRSKVDKEKLTRGTIVVLDMTTLTIIRTSPIPEKVETLLFQVDSLLSQVDSVVREEKLRKLKELIELPLKYPELFRAIGVGIEPPKVKPRKIASIHSGGLHPPSLLRTDRHPKWTCREMPRRHHRTKGGRRW